MTINFTFHYIFYLLLLIATNDLPTHAQTSPTKSNSFDFAKMDRVVHDLTLHNGMIVKDEEKRKDKLEQLKPTDSAKSYNIIKKNKRVTKTKPQDGNYEKKRVIDLTQGKVNRLKRQLTTHQAKGKTVFVKKEVVTKIDRLQKNHIVNVNVADTGLVALAIADQQLSDEKSSEVSVENDQDTTDNTLATFAVGSENTSANHLYRITKDGNYQYQDGKKMIGINKNDEWFQKGYKPITERTFFYEIADQPHIDLKVDNVGSFTSLSVEDQITLIKKSIKRSADYVELNELSRSKSSIFGQKEKN